MPEVGEDMESQSKLGPRGRCEAELSGPSVS